jgi:hypothetical protein
VADWIIRSFSWRHRQHKNYFPVTLTGTTPLHAGIFIKGVIYVKEGDKVLVPRTSGDFTPGTIIFVYGEKALVEFPIGLTFKGKPAPVEYQNEMGTKVVSLNRLHPLGV